MSHPDDLECPPPRRPPKLRRNVSAREIEERLDSLSKPRPPGLLRRLLKRLFQGRAV